MLVDDQLKNTVRYHLANWKALRGVTPFYSKMFWPPVDADPTPADEKTERFTGFPSVRLQVEEMLTEDQIERALQEYPSYSTIITAMKGLCNWARSRHKTDMWLRPAASRDNVTFDLIKKAYELETKATAEAWSPLEIVKFALKMKEFSNALSSPIYINIGRDVVFAYDQGEFRPSGYGSYLRRGNLQKALHVIAKHAMPPAIARQPIDLAPITADIASQGYDQVFVYDGMENGLCITGLGPIKSIRNMEKHLGSTMPIKEMAGIGKAKHTWSLPRVIRPLTSAEHGVRAFVVGGEIVAATAQTASAKPGHQTQPFIGEVGSVLRVAGTGPYKTQFEKSSVQPVLFKKIMEKANEVAADLKNIGEHHYAMDLLLDAEGDYAIDLYDLGSADYFALSPAIVAHAIQRMALRDMAVGVPAAEKFDTLELSRLASLSMKHWLPVKYTQEKRSGDEDRIFGDRTQHFSMIVESTARIRELLQVKVPLEQEQLNGNEVFLAKHLAISEDRRKEFDLKGFVDAVQRDFRERFPGNIDNLWNPEAFFRLVPLLDAALWFKNGQRQTWRYCLSNECEKTVTVRPIDSAPSRSEQRSHPNMRDPVVNRVTERHRNGHGPLGLYNADAHSSGFMSVPEYEMPFADTPDDLTVSEDGFDFDGFDFDPLKFLEEDKN